MKIWVVVGALDGKINEANVFLSEKEALTCEKKMKEDYSFPEIIRNDIAVFEREI